MTTAQDGPRRDNRLFMWAGHYSIWLLAPAVAAFFAGYLSSGNGRHATAVSYATSAVWVAWILSSVLDQGYHDARLCERCIAATPLDPQAAVTRWRPALRWRHSKFMLLAMLWAIVIFFTNTIQDGVSWWRFLLTAAAIGALCSSTFSEWVHRRLYPWCPFCHWGDGGDPEASPEPDPEDHGVKPVVPA